MPVVPGKDFYELNRIETKPPWLCQWAMKRKSHHGIFGVNSACNDHQNNNGLSPRIQLNPPSLKERR